MEVLELNLQTRDTLKNKAKDLLKSNLIPAEFYGKGVSNKSLQVDYQTFRKLFRVAGSNTVIELNIDGKEKANVLVHDIQRDPVTDHILHVDLINVRMDREIHTHIPLVFVGTASAVKELGGILTHHLTEIEVKCLPADLVHDIEVNVEPIVDFHSFVRVKDLTVPSKIIVMNDPEEIVVNAVAPRIEEEETPVAPAEGEAVTAEGEVAKEGEAVEGESAKTT